MSIEYLYNMSEEEKKQFPFAHSLIEEIVGFNKERHFDERGELLQVIENLIQDFSDLAIEMYVREVMLGHCEFPLPNVFDGWTDEEFDVLNKRYKTLKKLNNLTK